MHVSSAQDPKPILGLGHQLSNGHSSTDTNQAQLVIASQYALFMRMQAYEHLKNTTKLPKVSQFLQQMNDVISKLYKENLKVIKAISSTKTRMGASLPAVSVLAGEEGCYGGNVMRDILSQNAKVLRAIEDFEANCTNQELKSEFKKMKLRHMELALLIRSHIVHNTW
jgi:hypothetical protein